MLGRYMITADGGQSRRVFTHPAQCFPGFPEMTRLAVQDLGGVRHGGPRYPACGGPSTH